MKIYAAIAAVALVAILTTNSISQTEKTPLDRYFDSASAIIVAKCVAVGPMNILMRANVDLEVLLVLKGNSAMKKVSVDSQFGMEPGKTYLVRIEAGPAALESYGWVNSHDSVIPIREDVARFKDLPARIIVLRTINIRIEDVESKIRSLTYEMEALKALRKGN